MSTIGIMQRERRRRSRMRKRRSNSWRNRVYGMYVLIKIEQNSSIAYNMCW